MSAFNPQPLTHILSPTLAKLCVKVFLCALYFFWHGNSMAALASNVQEIGFVPHEPSTLDWQRDLGLRRQDVLSCEATNEAASWYDLCAAILSQHSQVFTFTINESFHDGAEIPLGYRQPRPSLLLKTLGNDVRLEFTPLLPVRYKEDPASKADAAVQSEILAEVALNRKQQSLNCILAPNQKLAGKIVQHKWILKSKQTNESLIIEHEALPLRFVKPFEKVGCQVVIFDGLLYKKYAAERAVGSLDVLPNRSLGVFIWSLKELQSLELSEWLTPNQPSQRYYCHQNYPGITEVDLCSLIDPATGQFTKDLKQTETITASAQNKSQYFSLVIGKESEDSVVERTALQFFVNFEHVATQARPKLFLAEKGAFQYLACVHPERMAPAVDARSVIWNINGEPLVGWTAPWLPPFLLSFGNEYSCSNDGKLFTSLRISIDNLSVLSPNRLIFLSHEKTKILRLETNFFLPDSIKWKCDSPTQAFGCQLLPAANGQVRILHVWRMPNTPPSHEDKVVVTLSQGEKAVQKVIFISTEALSASQSPRDISADVKLSRFANGSYSCGISDVDEERLSIMEIYWFLNGVEVKQGRGKSILEKPDIESSSLVTCQITGWQGRLPVVGLANIPFEPTKPVLSHLPEELLVDLSHPTFWPFEFSSTLKAKFYVSCALLNQEGEVLAKDLCHALPSTKPSSPLKSKLPSNRYALELNGDKLVRLREAIFTNLPVDLFAMEGFVLRLAFQINGYSFAQDLPVKLLFPNQKPKIDWVFQFKDEFDEPVCVFSAEDPDKNHLSASLSWEGESWLTETFSTLSPDLATRSLLKIFNAKEILNFPRYGLAGSSSFGDLTRQTPRDFPGILSPVRRQGTKSVRCSVMVSDGTLIAIAHARNLTSPKEASEAIKALSLAKNSRTTRQEIQPDLKKAEKKSTDVSKPLSSASQNLFKSFTARNIILKSPGVYLLQSLAPDSRLLSCQGQQEICQQIFVTDTSLSLANTSSVPHGLVHLSFYDRTKGLIFLSLDVLNQIFTPSERILSKTCLALITDAQNALLPDWEHLKFTAKFESHTSQGETPIPFSLIGRAIALGAQDIFCHLVIQNSLYRTVAIKSSSLRESIAMLPAPLPRNTINIDVPVLASLDQINILQLLSSQQNRDPFFPVFANSFKIQDCQWQSSGHIEKCQYNPFSLIVSTPKVQLDLVHAMRMSYQLLGRSRNVLARFESPSAPTSNATILPSVKIGRKYGTKHGFHCELSGFTPDSGTGEISIAVFGNETLIMKQSGPETRLEFEFPEFDSSHKIRCEVQHRLFFESATFRDLKGTEALRILCMRSTKNLVVLQTPCKLPSELDFNSERFEKDVFGSAEVPEGMSDEAFRYVIWSDEVSFRTSKTISVAAMRQGVPAPDKDSFAPTISTHSQASYLDEFSGRIICLYGLETRKVSKPGSNKIASKNSNRHFDSADCPLLGSLDPAHSRESVLDAEKFYYFNAQNSADNERIPDPIKYIFIPETEVIIGDLAFNGVLISQWVSPLLRLSAKAKSCHLTCIDSSTETHNSCQDLANRLALATSQACLFRKREGFSPESKPKGNTASQAGAQLLVDLEFAGRPPLQYSYPIVHFIPTIIEESAQ